MWWARQWAAAVREERGTERAWGHTAPASPPRDTCCPTPPPGRTCQCVCTPGACKTGFVSVTQRALSVTEAACSARSAMPAHNLCKPRSQALCGTHPRGRSTPSQYCDHGMSPSRVMRRAEGTFGSRSPAVQFNRDFSWVCKGTCIDHRGSLEFAIAGLKYLSHTPTTHGRSQTPTSPAARAPHPRAQPSRHKPMNENVANRTKRVVFLSRVLHGYA